uniref:Secreted protein n=1 Tax=Ascaris lumbricoides TaxID=6252 RepID=A0A0M3I8G1_ASCLU
MCFADTLMYLPYYLLAVYDIGESNEPTSKCGESSIGVHRKFFSQALTTGTARRRVLRLPAHTYTKSRQETRHYPLCSYILLSNARFALPPSALGLHYA